MRSRGPPHPIPSHPVPTHAGEQPQEHQVSAGRFFLCHQFQPCLFHVFLLPGPLTSDFSGTGRSARADPH